MLTKRYCEKPCFNDIDKGHRVRCFKRLDLLFQRLLVSASNLVDTNIQDVFQFELCAYPPTLFESVNLPNKADKPPLAKAIKKEVNDNGSTQLEFLTHKEECPMTTFAILEQNEIPIEIEYPRHTFLIDGGSLLYRLKWDKYKTVQEFIDSHCKFVKNQYGENAVIVFDGYSDKPSTKDITHHRRSRGKQYATIHLTSEMKVKGKKEDFLSNLKTKKRFIDMLILHFIENGITVVQAEGDADLLIVEEPLKAVKSMDTVVVGGRYRHPSFITIISFSYRII